MADLNVSPNTNVLKFLPSHYSVEERKFLWALLTAINGSNQRLEQLIQACIDQLFLSTAQGRYLVQLGEQGGFVMPQNSGLDIRAYRTLVPIMVADPKQVRQTIEEIVRAFYLSERVRPNLVSAVVDPYVLQDGDDLIIETQSGQIKISITQAQVNDLSNVTAAELAAIINSSQDEVLADTPVDRTSARNFLRVTSKAGGASANIRIAGGKLQNVLMFPNILDTTNGTGTTFNLTKTSPYSDQITFTWDGVGANPKIYNVSKDDVVTIRGLVDGVDPYSQLNGSYVVVDSGYDYFIVRNEVYDELSSQITQPGDNTIIFTSGRKNTIYDKDEYAIVSESGDVNTITVTVPAIPPLARRFLAGATHLRGAPLQVIDFTRNSLQLQLGIGVQKPAADNWFQMASDTARFNFREKSYKTTAVDSNDTQPTYTVASGDPDYSVLPFTVPSVTGVTNPIHGEVDSGEYTLNFNFAHGLRFPWGFTLAGATGGGGVLAGDLNKEHVVFTLVDANTLKFRLFDSGANLIKFPGFAWGPADLYQHSTTQPDGSDFYLEFPNSAAAIASGLTPGLSFRLDALGGTDIDGYIAGILRYRKLSVTSVNNNIINISTGYGIGGFGFIIDDVTGTRSGSFGGNPTYFLDKTSAHNQERVLGGLRAILYGYTTPQNPAFTNSYMYDPQGDVTKVTVSRFIVRSTDKIFKGDNLTAIEVDTTVSGTGEEYPQSGNLIMGYGTDKFEGPIRYYAVVKNPGNNQILIDPAYRFRHTHEAGTQVQTIYQNFPFTPGTDGSDFPCYITGTTTARETMFALIELLVAAGIFLLREVIKPELRYDDDEIVVFD